MFLIIDCELTFAHSYDVNFVGLVLPGDEPSQKNSACLSLSYGTRTYDDLDNQVRLIILKSLKRNTKPFQFCSTQPFSVNLIYSSSAMTNVTGIMHIKVGSVHLPT
jgi:hypothetical protein